jgi:hypothetical protein
VIAIDEIPFIFTHFTIVKFCSTILLHFFVVRIMLILELMIHFMAMCSLCLRSIKSNHFGLIPIGIALT